MSIPLPEKEKLSQEPPAGNDESSKKHLTDQDDSSKKHLAEKNGLFKKHLAGKNGLFKRDPDLEDLLNQYTMPEIRPDIRKHQIAQLSADIRDMEYFPPQSFTGQILTQLSFLSGWIWLAQAGMLFLLFLCFFGADPAQVNMMMFCLASGLSLILTFEISKSFRADVWEMEAACRYNLAQIFFFRLCILSGGDFLVLTAALIIYRMTGGPLWQFCLFTLLPFFLSSAVSLYALRRIGNRCHSTAIAVIPLFSVNLTAWLIPAIEEFLSGMGISLSQAMPVMTLLALAFLLYHAGRLCTREHYLSENSLAAHK